MQLTHRHDKQVCGYFGIDAFDHQTLVLGLAQHIGQTVDRNLLVVDVLLKDVGIQPLDIVDKCDRCALIHGFGPGVDLNHGYKAIVGMLKYLSHLGVLDLMVVLDALSDERSFVGKNLVQSALRDTAGMGHIVHRHRCNAHAHHHLAALSNDTFSYFHIRNETIIVLAWFTIFSVQNYRKLLKLQKFS